MLFLFFFQKLFMHKNKIVRANGMNEKERESEKEGERIIIK